MLQSLHIHNFALIEDLQLSFGEGITIFTGETGAGKSILLDAIGMLAGKRASASFVRQGTDAFRVEGAFFFSAIEEQLAHILEENHIDCDDGQLVICRQFYRSGRGTTLVNGTLVPTAVVRKIGEYLLDIHGQFDNRLIFDPVYHVNILDNLTPELQQARKQYDELYGMWHSLCLQARKLQHDEGEKARMAGILEFQIKEIESAQLRPGEDEELEKKVRAASHAEHIKDNLKESVFCLEGGERQKGIVEQLEVMHRCLEKASAYDTAFADLAAKVESLSYEVEDVHDGLMRYADSFEFDERTLDAMQSRLSVIDKLKRKYGLTIGEILEFLAEAKKKYEQLDQSESLLAKLQEDIKKEERLLRQQAETLLALRRDGDILFRRSMETSLHQLGMPNSRIAFHIEPMEKIVPEGAASIELYFSANTGESMQPLAKIASGGEISRIALALKSSTASSGKQTMIFDEIDVGISGQTGLKVAEHIRRLGQHSQVLCITHLPQTAATADHHNFIYKKEVDGRTISQVRPLSASEHVMEIARMFAGDEVTEASMEAARQIISQVRNDNL